MNDVGGVGKILRRAELDSAQPLNNASPAEPRVCMRNFTYAPRVTGEAIPVAEPDELVVVTVL
ncbi:hypothetical protein FACS1894184_16560 [Clostridia bacterium]|nr:hypothetical protein FACS1894184_16560 [Clostridia bacterium]